MTIYIIIPTYNEKENIIELLERLRDSLKTQGLEFKILVIDDNSPDGTADVVRVWGSKNKDTHVEVIVREGKKGLGSAILLGLKKAIADPEAEFFVTMDADLSHRPEDLPLMLKYAREADVVQGSRYVEGGKIIGWGFHRHIISKTANTLIRLIYKTGQRDNTSNYRVYNKRAAEALIKYADAQSYEWAIESILIPLACGLRVIESPIVFVNRTKGKSKLSLRDIIHWWIYIIGFKKRFNEIKKSCTKIYSSES
ncbi:MAG: polyprenol monophosphomannose synthase [Staphylothermus sp.]|nr:polyprenol monophosphomannose synthase [Staphylothermus sp.]